MQKIFHRLPILIAALFMGQLTIRAAIASGPPPSVDQNMPERLIIPTIDLDTAVVPVGLRTIEVNGQTYPIWATDKNGIGWHLDSGPPGYTGNTVLSGHSNGGGEIFRRLDEVAIDDEIIIQTDQGWYRYRVTQKLILKEQGEPVEVRAANAQWILPTTDERLTLITCWPYPLSTHRLLVIAHPITASPSKAAPAKLNTPIFASSELNDLNMVITAMNKQILRSIQAYWANKAMTN